MMIKFLTQADFNPKKQLELLCKRHSDRLEIDFLALEREIGVLQAVQEKSCEQIVEFVDQHRDSFIQINQQFGLITNQIQQSQLILKTLNAKIDYYKASIYRDESAIQQFINEYEYELIVDHVVKLTERQTAFLIKFNEAFQVITNKDVQALSFDEKCLISRFTHKLEYLRSLLSHQIILSIVPQSLQIQQVFANMADQLELYLAEQVSKISHHWLRGGTADMEFIEELQMWYVQLGKKEKIFEIIEDNLIGKELQANEKVLLSNKAPLMSGKEPQIIDNFFKLTFEAILRFPSSYPANRLLNILWSFLRKEELKFLYTYAMPIFPIAYQSYMNCLGRTTLPDEIRRELRSVHNWNLKMWAMVRQTNILNRSSGDADVHKWMSIIFKSSCIIRGTGCDLLRLALKFINRYCANAKSNQFSVEVINRLLEYSSTVPGFLRDKINQVFPREPGIAQLASKVSQNVQTEFVKAATALVQSSVSLVTNTCNGLLETPLSFVSRAIKSNRNDLINKPESVFKPIQAFLKNNSTLSPKAADLIQNVIRREVANYYDSLYVTAVYNYAKENLLETQTQQIMEVATQGRDPLFHRNQ